MREKEDLNGPLEGTGQCRGSGGEREDMEWEGEGRGKDRSEATHVLKIFSIPVILKVERCGSVTEGGRPCSADALYAMLTMSGSAVSCAGEDKEESEWE